MQNRERPRSAARLTPRTRAAALGRATEAMRQLEADPAHGRRTLGRGRDALNTVWNGSDPAIVHEAVHLLELLAAQPRQDCR